MSDERKDKASFPTFRGFCVSLKILLVIFGRNLVLYGG